MSICMLRSHHDHVTNVRWVGLTLLDLYTNIYFFSHFIGFVYRSQGEGLVMDAVSSADNLSHSPLPTLCSLRSSFHEGQTAL